MGCGCKNKNNGQQQPAQGVNTTVVNTQQQQNNESVKTSIQKIVEKYYNKK
jgi:DNA-binding protein Fis